LFAGSDNGYVREREEKKNEENRYCVKFFEHA